MKKYILLSIFFVQILSVYANNAGFREYQWGDSLEKIHEMEESRIIDEEQNCILCCGKLGSNDCTVLYIFKDGKLFSGMYVLKSEPGTENMLYESFLNSGNTFTDEFGESFNDTAEWLPELLKDMKNEYGFEREKINRKYSHAWNNNGTYISNFFGRSHWTHYHIIFYMDNQNGENIGVLGEEFWKNIF